MPRTVRKNEEAQRRQVASLSSYKLVYVLGEFNYTFHLPNAFLETALVVAWRRHSFAFGDNKKNTAKPSPSAFLPRTFFQCSLRFILRFVASLFRRTFALSLLFLLRFSFVFASWLFFRFLPFFALSPRAPTVSFCLSAKESIVGGTLAPSFRDVSLNNSIRVRVISRGCLSVDSSARRFYSVFETARGDWIFWRNDGR